VLFFSPTTTNPTTPLAVAICTEENKIHDSKRTLPEKKRNSCNHYCDKTSSRCFFAELSAPRACANLRIRKTNSPDRRATEQASIKCCTPLSGRHYVIGLLLRRISQQHSPTQPSSTMHRSDVLYDAHTKVF